MTFYNGCSIVGSFLENLTRNEIYRLSARISLILPNHYFFSYGIKCRIFLTNALKFEFLTALAVQIIRLLGFYFLLSARN